MILNEPRIVSDYSKLISCLPSGEREGGSPGRTRMMVSTILTHESPSTADAELAIVSNLTSGKNGMSEGIIDGSASGGGDDIVGYGIRSMSPRIPLHKRPTSNKVSLVAGLLTTIQATHRSVASTPT